MVEPATEAIHTAPPPCVVKKEVIVIDISSPPSSSSSPRPVMYLKRIEDMKHYEEVEDCFILGFDPTESIDLSKLAVSQNLFAKADDGEGDSDDELSVIGETGKVACRDNPHSRHLCVKFPFHTTSHHIHCQLCYCYVCDSQAPCKSWTEPPMAHCDASDKDGMWLLMRRLNKEQESRV